MGEALCAGGSAVHDHSQSGNYSLRITSRTGGEAYWKMCSKCQVRCVVLSFSRLKLRFNKII